MATEATKFSRVLSFKRHPAEFRPAGGVPLKSQVSVVDDYRLGPIEGLNKPGKLVAKTRRNIMNTQLNSSARKVSNSKMMSRAQKAEPLGGLSAERNRKCRIRFRHGLSNSRKSRPAGDEQRDSQNESRL